MIEVELNDRTRRWAGLLLMTDGTLTALLGRHYVRLWIVGPEGTRYRRGMEWLLNRPPWLLRVAGLFELGVGLRVMGTAPLSIHEIYSSVAGAYEAIETEWRDILYIDAHRAFDQAMVRHLPPGGDVLDLGCGTGANLARLLDLDQPFGSYTGVDKSAAMLERARDKGDRKANVRLLQLDLETDPLPEGPFDLVISTWALEHLDNPRDVVQKAWDRLRPGGSMVLLFEVRTDYWLSRVVNRILHFLTAHQVPEEVYVTFPGFVSARTYRGAFGDLGLIVLHKPYAVA